LIVDFLHWLVTVITSLQQPSLLLLLLLLHCQCHFPQCSHRCSHCYTMAIAVTTAVSIAFTAAIAIIFALATNISTFVIAAVTNATAAALYCPWPSLVVPRLLQNCTSSHRSQ
jgi:hypothetical protein